MDISGTVVTTPQDSDGFPPFDAARVRPATLTDCHSAADSLDYLCGAVEGSYQRRRNADGSVTLRVKTRDGDVLAATKATTEACVTQLLTRAGVTP